MEAKYIGTVAEIKRSSTEIVRVSCVEFKSRKYIDVRIWYATNDGEHRPTTKGIRVNGAALPGIIKALQEAHQVISAEEAKEDSV